MSKRLRVNPIACDAHGLCAELFPEHVELDDWGYPIIRDEPIPRRLERHARRAVAACPAAALALVETKEAAPQRPRGGSMRAFADAAAPPRRDPARTGR